MPGLANPIIRTASAHLWASLKDVVKLWVDVLPAHTFNFHLRANDTHSIEVLAKLVHVFCRRGEDAAAPLRAQR